MRGASGWKQLFRSKAVQDQASTPWEKACPHEVQVNKQVKFDVLWTRPSPHAASGSSRRRLHHWVLTARVNVAAGRGSVAINPADTCNLCFFAFRPSETHSVGGVAGLAACGLLPGPGMCCLCLLLSAVSAWLVKAAANTSVNCRRAAARTA